MIMGVVADDITGSSDIGVMFARAGCLSYVYDYGGPGSYANLARQASENGHPEPDIAIINTGSRLDAPEIAYQKVFEATRQLQAAGCTRFFNKTCSVFRGNIGAEFDAMLDALGLEFAIVVLGFPKNGRTTINGIHYVHGKRLEDSEFRNDPIHPMRISNLVDILQSQTRRRVGAIFMDVICQGIEALRSRIAEMRAEYNYVILDVAGQDTLRTIAQAVRDEPVLCGSSAMGEELPPAWNFSGSAQVIPLPPAPAGEQSSKTGVLCVAGSLTPQTKAQLLYLTEQGVDQVELNTSSLFAPGDLQDEIGRLACLAAERLSAGQDVVLKSPNEPQSVERTIQAGAHYSLDRTQVSRLVSQALAEASAAALALAHASRLVIAGGETSAMLTQRLGIQSLRICEEIEPGVPSCQSLSGAPMLLVLKSGSFGSREFLWKAMERVK